MQEAFTRMKKEFTTLIRGPIRDFGSLGLGNLLAFGITLLSYPILSRLYNGTEFGEFAVFQSIFLILMHLSTLNYQEAIMLLKSEDRLRQFIKTLIIIIFIITLLVSIFIALSGFQLLGLSISKKYLWLLPIVLLFGSITQVNNFIILRKKNFKQISIIKVTERISFQVSTITFALLKFTYNGLIVGMLTGQFAAFLISISSLKTKIRNTFSLRYARALLSKYRSFPLFALPGGILEKISRYLPILLISSYLGHLLTGQYAMAYKILSLPEMIIGATIGQLFYQRVGSRFLSKERIKPLIVKVWLFQAALGILPMLAIIFFGKELFSTILGDSWVQAGEMAQILALLIFSMFISTPTSSTLNILNQQHVGLVFGIITLVTRSLSLISGLKYFNLQHALMLYVGVEVIVIIAFNIVLLKAVANWENKIIGL